MPTTLVAPPRFQIPDTIGPATSSAVPPGTTVVIASLKAALEADIYLVSYGIQIGTPANQNFATFYIRINGVIFRTDATQFGSLTTPQKFPSPQKIPSGAFIELVGAMSAGAAGNTDMAAILNILSVGFGQTPIVA
jgi:hypothetical protein